MALETFNLERLKRLKRPPAYLADCLLCDVDDDPATVTFDTESDCYRRLTAKYNSDGRPAAAVNPPQPAAPAQPVPTQPTPTSPPQTAVQKAGGLFRYVVGGVTGLVKAGIAVTLGHDESPPEVLAARQAVCNVCPWRTDTIGGLTTKCTECGCVLPAKQRLLSYRCRVGGWDHIATRTDDQKVLHVTIGLPVIPVKPPRA